MRKIARHRDTPVSLILLEEKLASEQGLQIWECSCGCSFVSVYYASFHIEKKHRGELFEDRIRLKKDFDKDSAKWRHFYTEMSENIFNSLVLTTTCEKSNDVNISDNTLKSAVSTAVPSDPGQLPNSGSAAIDESAHSSRKRCGEDTTADNVMEKRLKLYVNNSEKKMSDGKSSNVTDINSLEKPSTKLNVDSGQSFLDTSSLTESAFSSFSEIATDQNGDNSSSLTSEFSSGQADSLHTSPMSGRIVSLETPWLYPSTGQPGDPIPRIRLEAICELKDPRKKRGDIISKSIYSRNIKPCPEFEPLPVCDSTGDSQPMDIASSPISTTRSVSNSHVVEKINTNVMPPVDAPCSSSAAVVGSPVTYDPLSRPYGLQLWSATGHPLYPEEYMMVVPHLENRIIPNPIYYPYPDFGLIHPQKRLFYADGSPTVFQLQKWENFFHHVQNKGEDPHLCRASWMRRYVAPR